MTIPFALFSLLFAYVSHHICLVAAATSPLYPLPFILSFASLDTHGNGIAESSWLTDYYNNSCRYRLCDDLDASAMFACLGVLFLLLCRSGIGSRSAAWASRVDVVWVFVCVSFVVGWWSYVWWCCIHVALFASCMYPHILCNVDVMISTLQKRFNMWFYPWWDLRVSLG